MKKLAAFLLVSVMLCSLAACGTNTVGPSDPDIGTESVATESAAPWVENEKAAQIRSLLSGEAPDRSMKGKNLLADIAYAYTVEPVDSYADPNRTKLRDGVVRDVFDAYTWVGFRGGKNPSVDYDLGGQEHGLSVVTVHCLRQTSYGIELPTEVSLCASDDGETYTVLSTLRSPQDLPGSGSYTYRFSLPETLRARYLRILLPYRSGFVFVDEIAGYAYCADGNVDLSAAEPEEPDLKEYDFYHYALRTDISTPVSETDSDYDRRQNLALLDGVQVQADHFDPMDESVCNANTPPEKLNLLVDGTKAKAAVYGDSAFVRFVRGYGRHVVVDLGNEMAVDEVTLQFLNQISVGVGAPPSVMIECSSDGEHWTTVYAQPIGVYGDRETKLIDVKATFPQAYRCRYIRSAFLTVPYNTTSSSAYLSEIEVFGKKNTADVPEAVADPDSIMGKYPDPNAFGCENILLVPLGGGNEFTAESAGMLSRYVDEQGNAKGQFFDSLVISAANSFQRADDCKETLRLFYEEVFASDKNLAAWDQVSARQTGEQKTTIWFGLFCPQTGSLCSDLDGDGQAEDLSTAEGRFTYLKYQVDTVISRMQAYEHLELLGFYWIDEYLNENELALNKQSIQEINAYIHTLGYKSLWCPYFNAYGFWAWNEIGFDLAVLQPNYMFYATERTRLSTTAETARMLGMSVELEIEDHTSAGSISYYREYLRQGYDSGFMNSIKMYYHGGSPGAFYQSAKGKTKSERTVYEETYLLATRALDDSYNRGAAGSLDSFRDLEISVQEGRTESFAIGELAAYRLSILQSPVFGKLQINQNGEAKYSAMKNYRGEERLILLISDAVGNQKEITVTVHITE